jgi:hypothetical protein
VPTVYEGWIFEDAYFSNPYCVIVTELPAGVTVGEHVEHRVAFDGYFFKKYMYQAGDGKRLAPLLIGRTLALREPPPASAWSFSQLFLPLFVGLLLATALLVVALGWWFRRGDRLVRSRLATAQMPNFPEPLPARDEQAQPLNGHSG